MSKAWRLSMLTFSLLMLVGDILSMAWGWVPVSAALTAYWLSDVLENHV